MNLEDYLRLVANKVEAAQAKNDKEEVLRLLDLLRKVCEEQIAANS